MILIELTSEVIAVHDSENSAIHIEVLTNIDVSPVVDLAWNVWMRDFVSLKKNSLWDSRVFYSWLSDVQSVVIQVVVNQVLSDPVVLRGILDNRLLEVSIETKDLHV